MLSFLPELWLDLLVIMVVGCTVIAGVFTLRKLSAEGASTGTIKALRPEEHIPPHLVPESVELAEGNQEEAALRLSLLNKGRKLIFRSISIQDGNELKVFYDEDRNPSAASDQALRFYLRGQQAEKCTYHFNVIYSDQRGNTYSQGIAGWGKERPLIEEPLLIVA